MQEELHKDDKLDYIKLDPNLKTDEERIALVNKIIESTPPEKLTNTYLTKLADYLVVPQRTKKGEKILTPNRKKVIYERETSLEGLTISFNNGDLGNSNGEDNIYNLIIDNKEFFLTPRYKKISDEEIEEIPGMKQITEAIERLKEEFKKAKTGAQKRSIKNNIIELYKDRYALRASYKGEIRYSKPTKSVNKIELYENVTLDKDGELIIDANISLLIPQHVSCLLCKYSTLKQECYSKFESDMYYMLLALEDYTDKALAEMPLYKDLLIYKIDGMQNTDIQKKLEEDYGIKYSVEYISSLWRNKIPKLIAEQAKEDWLIWHFTEEEKGVWKKCSKCGQIKLAHNKFFSKNKTSKDGYYSICKKCRNRPKKIEYKKKEGV